MKAGLPVLLLSRLLLPREFPFGKQEKIKIPKIVTEHFCSEEDSEKDSFSINQWFQ